MTITPDDAGETRSILISVDSERAYQRAKWGNHADNAINTPNDFVAYLTAQAAKWHPGGFAPYGEETIAAFRQAMIKTAAVAVAGAEFATRLLEAEIDRPDVALFAKSMKMPPVFDADSLNPGAVISTIRVGDKWLNAVSPGETIKLVERDTGRLLAHARVTEVEQGLWADVQETTPTNFAFFGDHSDEARLALRQAVIEAYPIEPEAFDDLILTVVHMTIKDA